MHPAPFALALALAASPHTSPPLTSPAFALDPADAGPVPADADASPVGETVLVGPGFLDPVLPLDAKTRAALATRDHAAALAGLKALDHTKLHGHQLADRAFLLAWTLLRTGDEAAAIPLIPEILAADHVPPAWQDTLLGELLLADGKAVEAAEALRRVPEEAAAWPRAMLLLAKARQEAGATADAVTVWEKLAARPDPASGTAPALLAMAKKAGVGSDKAYPHLRRLWSQYPSTGEGRAAAKYLASYEPRGRQYRPRDADIAARGSALMGSWQFAQVIEEFTPLAGRFVTPDENYCSFWYALGRSNFKRNNVTKASEMLDKAGRKCAGIDEDRGAKSLYIAGKSLERLKRWQSAARSYKAIPALYPEHTMADDGYALAGIALQNAGNPSAAIALWESQVSDYPKGDLAGEGFWRLAWSAYLAGDAEAAITWAERSIWEVPVATAPVHALAARYWAARWRIYPDVAHPRTQNLDAEQVQLGINHLLALCKDFPTSFYALLAAQRLYTLAPKELLALTRPPPGPHPDALGVRAAFLVDPAVREGLELARLGLAKEALAGLERHSQAHLAPGEAVLVAEVAAMADPIMAHDRLHHFLLEQPPSTLGADRDRVLREAFPDMFWDEVQQATETYSWDPRVFHALVREESSFNPSNVSWAGARGLCQLMPATARQVGAWMDIKVTKSSMIDPLTNLRIGSRYLDYLHGYFDQNLFMAVPSYNAGEGNVGKWKKRLGDVPTDEFVESIPIRETRGYVKRVLGTYQLYRVVYDSGPLFPDWSHTANHIIPPK
jgi:soluble lytic murein transglycosylase